PEARTPKGMWCPSDPSERMIPPVSDPISNPGGGAQGIVSYSVNAGASSATKDRGAFTTSTDEKLKINAIADGTSSTILLGEHSNNEPNWKVFATQSYGVTGVLPDEFKTVAWTGGIWAQGILYCRADAQINFRITPTLAQAASTDANVYLQ